MESSPTTRRFLARLRVTDWSWWHLNPVSRVFVGIVPLVAVLVGCLAAVHTTWRAAQVATFALLLFCGMVSVVVTPHVAYLKGGMTRDFLTVWVLPIAVLLPPVYAIATPVPLVLVTQWRIHGGVFYRRVYTTAAIGLGYGAASAAFHAWPAHLAGSIGLGMHALTWTLAVSVAEMIGWLGHHLLLIAAIKLTDRRARLADLELNREAIQADFAQIDLGIITTVVVGVSPVLAIFAVPTVLLARRFIMHAQLLAKSRIDSKTELLNASTWENEADEEIARAIRTRSPLSVALVDIDHFKAVNDTYGHLVGDMALRAVADAIREQLRSYDVAGRFGGEEFVVLLPHAAEADAMVIAERLRTHIAAMAIPVAPDHGASISLTVSVGVAALDGTARELTDLLAAADSALYYAKENGRNKTHAMAAVGLR